jgi:hypothetical protein
MGVGGPGGRQDALEFQRGHHIGIAAVTIFGLLTGVEDLEAGRQDHRADVQMHHPVGLGKIYGLGGAEFLAGPAFAFKKIDAVFLIYGIFQRHRLGIEDISRLAGIEPLVKLVGHFLGAFFSADTAGNAAALVDVPGFLEHLDLIVAGVAGDAGDLGRGQNFNIEVAAHLHQFRRQGAHGTVVGRKGLIQLRHDAADSGFFLHQVDKKSGFGQIQRRLDAGDTPSHHQNRTSLLVAILGLLHGHVSDLG